MVFGAFLIISQFYLFTTLTLQIAESTELTQEQKGSYTSLIGIANGVFMVIGIIVYDVLSKMVVKWENHRYESDYQNSMIVKSFAFNFFISYVTLFYYAFFFDAKNREMQFLVLGANFIAIVIAKNVVFIITTNLIPYLSFVVKKWKLAKKWKVYKKENKEKFVS